MKAICVALLSVLLGAVSVSPVLALTITNDTEESLKVTIEKWQRRVNPGDSAEFTPTSPPVLLQFELRYYYITCEAGADDKVRVETGQCYVNGVAAGESQVRM